MKKIQTLNEELNRMKGLMNFKLGQKSADLLKEQEEPIDNQEEPIDNQEDCITVKHTGTFAVDEHVGSDAFNQFMSKIKEQISTLGDSEKTLKSIKVFGGASNHYDGKSVNPDWSNDWEVSDNQSYERDKNSEEYKYNKELAAKRAKNVVNKMTDIGGLFEELGVSFRNEIIDDVLTNMKGYVIDTGGKNDNKRDESIYKPGQIVNLELEICGSIGEQDIPEDFQCFEDVLIELRYDEVAEAENREKNIIKHNCNYAVYELYANGHKLIRDTGQDYASLNNTGKLDDGVKIGPVRSDYRTNKFILSSEGENSEFFSGGYYNKEGGNIELTAKCIPTKGLKPEKWGQQNHFLTNDRYKDYRKFDCHKGVGRIKITLPDQPEINDIVVTPSKHGEEIVLGNYKICNEI